MKDFDILSPITTISGVISILPVDKIVSTYALLITVVCGSVSIFRVILHIIHAVKKFRAGKLTIDEAIKEFDELKGDDEQ